MKHKIVNKNKSCDKSRDYDKSCRPLSLFSIDNHSKSVPAAGWRNGTSLNNAGENGNYWCSTPNESDTKNAYNLNFNSGNQNVNWNNRNNGHTVRPVAELTSRSEAFHGNRHFSISKEQLLKDLYRAYKDARRHKRSRSYQLEFEFNLEDNLISLRDELISGTYRPMPSSCFIIHDPKMREVFAADFRDRIVHHLFYNYTHLLFERTFIYDSYSCIEKRGTHFGIDRLKHHIRGESAGYSRRCYILKIDIRGYFMNINRQKLMELCIVSIEKMRRHKSNVTGKTWEELLDYEFVYYLLRTIIFIDPIVNCKVIGKVEDWQNLPQEKSLFFASPGCGLPIGNLSSQLFSNIYMNIFDQYVKRTLSFRHYGRYVDDAYIVSADQHRLKSIIPLLSNFLKSQLGLNLHARKTVIFDVHHGVEFLGAYIKPFRTYISSSSLKRMKCKLKKQPIDNTQKLQASINSYLGVLSHYHSYCLRRILFGCQNRFCSYGSFDRNWLTFQPYKKLHFKDFVY